jgi:hypothetical protein
VFWQDFSCKAQKSRQISKSSMNYFSAFMNFINAVLEIGIT